MITPFTGQLKVRSTALPPSGQTMIQDPHFSNLRWPAKFCQRSMVGEAIRLGRTL